MDLFLFARAHGRRSLGTVVVDIETVSRAGGGSAGGRLSIRNENRP